MATNRINARQNWQLGFFYAPVKIFFGFSQTRSALHAMGTCRTPCYMLHGLEGLIRTYTNQTLLLYCIHTLPRRGINWEILPPRTKRFPKSRDFAPRGLKLPMYGSSGYKTELRNYIFVKDDLHSQRYKQKESFNIYTKPIFIIKIGTVLWDISSPFADSQTFLHVLTSDKNFRTTKKYQ